MALDINGYNSTFKSFVDFAQERILVRVKEVLEC